VSNQEIGAQVISVESIKCDPSLVTFVCDWCLRADADLEILESYPPNVRVVHIPCSGRIDPEMALLALRSGIDGVLVCGCKPGECHYQRGTLVSDCKLSVLDRMFEEMGINQDRVHLAQIGTTDRGRIRMEIDSMLETLTAQKEAH
jgi:coenzyme F420-reducing hydrogenase delta subunit